ncbi:HlyD family efflux transporter periplasmic adaptor subunit [Butyrivibrio sp. MC2021]|uniref:HlyD family efflux transporter periplasmic adaptor subunit n=1 Tax=Butyrivibrio sp. MC2021 TaxID=1408306 RepID=UPI000AE66CEB|nr:HlyD family efflux transporter periplasmic adaptor subunit [Butyrivibrio sp. MC2021]
MANKSGRNITKYPKNLNNLNIGMIFFIVIAIYVVISVVTYLRKDHIIGYEVKEGSLSSNNIYESIALRKEKIIESDSAGNVNYFASEGGRVAVGNLVYTVDESGKLLDYLKSQGTEEASLSDNDMSELRSQIVSFHSTFDNQSFYTVYDFKVSLDGTVQKLSNNNILQNIQSLNNSGGALNSIGYKYSPDTGIVIYSVDGYEEKTLQDLKASDFDQTDYEKTQLINNNLVKAGDPVFKLCTNEEWSVVIQENDEKKVQELLDLQYVKIRFIKNQDESWGKVSSFTNDEGDTFVAFTFTNSMITFCRDRFLSVELITEDQKGLKIPNSAIVNKSFYLLPKDYVIKNNDNTSGVLRSKYDEQGNETSEFVNLSIYNETETEYYVDTSQLRSGDNLIKPDSNDRYVVSRTDTLVGVYNINKGYADFRQIRILYSNEEYSIVKSNTMYGLNVYDYIVLDASVVDESGTSKYINDDNAAVSEEATDEASDEEAEDETEEIEESVEEASESDSE